MELGGGAMGASGQQHEQRGNPPKHAPTEARENHLDKTEVASYAEGVGSLVDYDKHYRNGRGQCGEPFPMLVDALRAVTPPARVLDLGCGQGRDALLAARMGHDVVGVDLSRIGVEQMLEDAESEGLRVEGVVSDVLDFRSRRKFDVVILDRVLHLLLDDAERTRCLDRVATLTKKRGLVLVADVPKNAALIWGRFDDDRWTIAKRTKNYLFASRR
jgi:2-polyprenyl-3-methyl-5-hydroxy-6-metoxy-1,4-benzoquinol methylase